MLDFYVIKFGSLVHAYFAFRAFAGRFHYTLILTDLQRILYEMVPVQIFASGEFVGGTIG